MDLLEHVLLAVELENDHTSAVGSNDDEINIIACVSEEKTIPTRESERLHRSDQSVHFEAANHVDVASIIGSPEFDDVSARHDKLLDSGRTEVSWGGEGDAKERTIDDTLHSSRLVECEII